MKLFFLKDWENFPGHTIEAGREADVLAEVARELIKSKTARKKTEHPLPADIPGHKYLILAGIDTLEKLIKIGDTQIITGIGKITAQKIENYLK